MNNLEKLMKPMICENGHTFRINTNAASQAKTLELKMTIEEQQSKCLLCNTINIKEIDSTSTAETPPQDENCNCLGFHTGACRSGNTGDSSHTNPLYTPSTSTSNNDIVSY
jgi:hypothetical protein